MKQIEMQRVIFMNEEQKPIEQNVTMQDRRHLEMTGIDGVESFCDTEILLRYADGSISVDGEELKVELFNAETHRLTLSGLVNCIEYFGSAPKTKGKGWGRK